MSGGLPMETIAWIPRLSDVHEQAAADEQPGAIPVVAPVVDSPGRGAPRPDPASPVPRPAGRTDGPRGSRWQTIMILAVAATVVWVLAWRNERMRLESQRRDAERIASRPGEASVPQRSDAP